MVVDQTFERGAWFSGRKGQTKETFERGLWHQNHAKMNACILGDAMAVQKWIDQKVVNCVCAKAQHKWDKMLIVLKQCPPLPKPTLVKLTSKQLLQVLGLSA
jgi:hypothetical protein